MFAHRRNHNDRYQYGRIKGKPDYELEFEPLWNEKESERATIEQTNAQADLVRAQTAQLYIDMGVLDPAEERKRLKEEGKFGIEDEELPQREEPFGNILAQLGKTDNADTLYDGATGVGVIVVKNGKILVGNRDDNNQVGSPGGHIETWEDAERAARRETEEEFGITLNDLIPIGMLDNLPEEYGKSFLFLSTDFNGVPHTNTQEMRNNRFQSVSELLNEDLYVPFKFALERLIDTLQTRGINSQ